jgi:hypothetical protein
MLTCRYQNKFCGLEDEDVRKMVVIINLKQAADGFVDDRTCTSHFEGYHVVSPKCRPKLRNFTKQILKLIYFSRTLKDELLGKKLVDLPQPSTELVKSKASDPERIFYEAVQARQVELHAEKLDDDDPRKGLSNTLAQITCLRQSITLLLLVRLIC